MSKSNETDALLRAILTAHVQTQAQAIFHSAQIASQPHFVDIGHDANGNQLLQSISTPPRKTWEQALNEAADQIAEDQPTVLQLLQDRGLLPR